jgi:hypothetical protein
MECYLSKKLFLGGESFHFWRDLHFLLDHLVALNFVAGSLLWVRPIDEGITRNGTARGPCPRALSYSGEELG